MKLKNKNVLFMLLFCLNTICTTDKSLISIERHGIAQIEFLPSSVANAIHNYTLQGFI